MFKEYEIEGKIQTEINSDYLVAGDPQTDKCLLNELADSEYAPVRRRVAENSNTSLRTLFRLLFDENPEVRLGLVDNKRIPQFFIEHLLTDSNEDLRLSLAENYKLSLAQLRKLLVDENPYVAARAEKTLYAKRKYCTTNSGCLLKAA